MFSPALYRYDLLARRNVWVNWGAELFWGYSQDELHSMGDQVLGNLIHTDDLHLVERHHHRLGQLARGQSSELFCRAWGRDDTTPRFVRFCDICVVHDGDRCTVIEGEVVEVSAGAFDARKLIERGLLRQELTLHYQPICHLSTGEVAGYEALARWIRYGGAPTPPSEFLPLIEGTSLELPWVKHQIALVEAALTAMPESLWVGLNISESVLATHTLPQLLTGGNDSTRLHIEVLESVSLRNPDAISALKEIQASRHLIFADDIGADAGLSRFLERRLFDGIKLDRILVQGLPGDHVTAAITRRILELSNDLGLISIAEWVQTRAQVDWLLAHGCQLGQGSFYGMPKSLDRVPQK
jgi:EAL domain-containing protein (putative c-di-GMP-specific phosphodiesterase class I)